LSDRLKANTYLSPALSPETPWLAVEKVPAAKISLVKGANDSQPTKVTWEVPNPEALRRWCVYQLVADKWQVSIVGAQTRSLELDPPSDPAKRVRAIAVAGVDGSGTLSRASILAIE
ncbi:MAG: hypothetical protein ACKOAH_13830, partial [Pirellula sp.]